jgi:hypothetical protein
MHALLLWHPVLSYHHFRRGCVRLIVLSTVEPRPVLSSPVQLPTCVMADIFPASAGWGPQFLEHTKRTIKAVRHGTECTAGAPRNLVGSFARHRPRHMTVIKLT